MANFIDRVIGSSVARIVSNMLNVPGVGVMTHSGVTIDPETPFTLNAVRAAVSVLSQDVASTPLELWRMSGTRREKAREHPLYDVLAAAPNPRMTAFELREASMVALLTWGNSYAYIQRDASARVIALWPLRPDRMTVYLGDDNRLRYQYRAADGTAMDDFSAYEILHIKGMSSDGLVGRTPLHDLREKFGEITATERFSQSFYGNGMKRSAVLSVPGQLSPTAHENLRTSFRDNAGSDKAWQTLILEEGMDFKELSFAPEDAQLLETRGFSIEEIARAFNLPLFKLRMSKPGAVSYASVEAQQLDYLLSTLNGWYIRIEQAVNRACLSYDERKSGLYVVHNTRTMLRADLQTQAEVAKILRESSLASINECREDFGYNPSPDPRADDLFAPTYVQSTSKAMNAPDEPDDDEPEAPPAE